MSDFRRHPVSRLLVTLWACWFVLLVSEPVLLHACPMHDGTAATAMAADGHGTHGAPRVGTRAASDPASHMASRMASHMAPDMAMHVEPDASSDQHGQHPASHSCSCMGHCAASSPLAPSTPAPLSWLAGVVDIAPELVIAHQSIPVEPDYLLPFANGPPLSSRA